MSASASKAPKKRASTPRSKNGCITCKIRRLKCGEEKPGCQRCAKSGWQCDGYEHTGESSSTMTSAPSSSSSVCLIPLIPRSTSRQERDPRSPRLIAAQSQSPSMASTSQITSISPQAPLQLDADERSYFQAFIDEVPTQLLTHHGFFWKGVAVQESHSTSCVRHAIIALGALTRSMQIFPSGNYLMNGTQGFHREFALQQHEKAIRSLREAISIQEPGEATRSIIISCLVLAFLDNFIGNSGFAMQHLRYVRQVLFKTGKELHTPPAFPNLDNPNEVTISMFFRLDMQAISAMGSNEDRILAVTPPRNTPVALPAIFQDLQEAKHYQRILVWEGANFWYRTLFGNYESWEAIPQAIVEQRDYLIQQMHFFHRALEPLLLDEGLDLNIHPLRRASSMKLYSVVILINLTLSLDSPEINTDLLQSYFQYIVSLCRETLEFESVVDGITRFEIFSFEVRTIEPLFLVATKCRDGNLRRQAISLLLSSHRREMAWDSFLAGRIASWVMTIEEQGMDIIGFVPEERRSWGLSTELDLQRKVVVVSLRVGRKSTGEWVEVTQEMSCDEVVA